MEGPHGRGGPAGEGQVEGEGGSGEFFGWRFLLNYLGDSGVSLEQPPPHLKECSTSRRNIGESSKSFVQRKERNHTNKFIIMEEVGG